LVVGVALLQMQLLLLSHFLPELHTQPLVALADLEAPLMVEQAVQMPLMTIPVAGSQPHLNVVVIHLFAPRHAQAVGLTRTPEDPATLRQLTQTPAVLMTEAGSEQMHILFKGSQE
jgi:hypothetical protein